MKTTQLFLSIFLLFVIYINPFRTAAAALEPVLDASGRNLRADAHYYILPVDITDKGRGGGLTLSGVGDYTCPLAVVQEPCENRNGLRLRFYPLQWTRNGIIPLATDLNIEFSDTGSCGESTVWKLDDYDESIGKYFVGVGGVVGDPSAYALSNWFKIERYGYGYKLVYCPTVCSDCDVVCKDIGIVYQDGQRRLALTDGRPLKIIFRLAK